jgi:hypothetical protein
MNMSDTKMRRVRTLEEGVQVGRVARKRGYVGVVDEEEYAELAGRGLVEEVRKLKVTPRTGGMIGTACFQPGMPMWIDVPGRAEDPAWGHYIAGNIDIDPADARAAGVDLPGRKADRAAGQVKVKTKEGFQCPEHPHGVAADQVVEVPLARAEELTWRGFAEPVGWQCRPEPRVFFRVTVGGLRDQIFILAEAEATRREMGFDGHIIRQGGVRVMSLKDDNYIGPDIPALRYEQVADVEPAIALDLIDEGRAKLVGVDTPLTPVAAPPAKKARG